MPRRVEDGTIRQQPRGYLEIKRTHPSLRCVRTGWVLHHLWVVVVLARKGNPLPPGAQVHHWDGDKSNNSNRNLVVCQDAAYHNLLHRRQRAYAATGDANAGRCIFCGEYSVLSELAGSFPNHAHRECRRQYCRKYHAAHRDHRNLQQRERRHGRLLAGSEQ